MSLASYRGLRVWQIGMEVAEQCYRVTAIFPREELFGLVTQIRRSAAAVPANIAEGYGRGYRAEYVQFLRIAQGSLKELETHLLLSARVEIVAQDIVDPILLKCDDLGRMLSALIRSLQDKDRRPDTRHPTPDTL
jgi:four helix bundle protein